MDQLERIKDLFDYKMHGLSSDAEILPMLFPVFDKEIIHIFKWTQNGNSEKLFTILPSQEDAFGVEFIEWIRGLVE
jgi:hypothetical protein